MIAVTVFTSLERYSLPVSINYFLIKGPLNLNFQFKLNDSVASWIVCIEERVRKARESVSILSGRISLFQRILEDWSISPRYGPCTFRRWPWRDWCTRLIVCLIVKTDDDQLPSGGGHLRLLDSFSTLNGVETSLNRETGGWNFSEANYHKPRFGELNRPAPYIGDPRRTNLDTFHSYHWPITNIVACIIASNWRDNETVPGLWISLLVLQIVPESRFAYIIYRVWYT